MASKVAVLGAGSWGTALAALVAARAPVTLWARRPQLAEGMRRFRTNPDYLPDLALPAGLRCTSSLPEATDGADLVIVAVPSHGFRAIVDAAVAHLAPGVPVLSVTKGIEQGSLKRMTEVVAELAPGHPRGVLTGPNLVREVVAGYPTASVVAVEDPALAVELQDLLNSGSFRVYTNPDVVGCELGGAVKNVMAIASGISDGMGFGDNARAALITRGLAEITRLGVSLGGQPLTFAGLTGMGDLVATCMSRQSRNRYVGEQLGRGRSIDAVTGEMRMVAEGVRTSAAVVALAARASVEMPIAEQVAAVIADGKPARQALSSLMLRDAKAELHGIGHGDGRPAGAVSTPG